ncbi:MAG: WD40/YVTN/BNR-like repeat-containing protein [Candidatus Methylomirabilales bacterium]
METLRARWRRLLPIMGLAATAASALLHVGQAAGEGQDSGHLHALLVSPSDESLWIGAHNGLYRSDDAGKSWRPVKIPAGLAAMDFMSFAQDPTNPKVLYAGTHNRGVVRTTDGGKTWGAFSAGLGGPDVHALAVDGYNPSQPKRWYAWVVDKGLYRVLGELAEWKRVDDGPASPDVRALQAVNIPTGMGGIFLYAATAEGIFRGPDCF